MKLKKKRTKKKYAKRFLDWFFSEKIPLAFENETERRKFISAMARRYVGQRSTYPQPVKNKEA